MGVHGVYPTAMKSPFSNWTGESDAESQMKQARLKVLGKRRKSHKKIALEVVEEAEKEGEEGPAMSGLSGSPNLESMLADALQDSLHTEAMASSSSATAPTASTAIATAVSQGIDDSSLGAPSHLGPRSPSPVLQSPFASRAAAASDVSGALNSAEADTAIAANLRRTLNRLNTLSLPVALATAKSDALPDSPDAAKQEPPASTSARVPSNPAPPKRSPLYKNSTMYGQQATWQGGWDVVTPADVEISKGLWQVLHAASGRHEEVGSRLQLQRGHVLQQKDQACRQFHVLLSGHMFAERTRKSGQLESAVVVPGSLLGCAAYLSSTKTRAIIRTAEPCKLVAFGPHELEKLLAVNSTAFIELLLAAGRALGPIIRQFFSLGLNRVWLNAGDTAYKQDEPASCLYVLISGRIRLIREDASMRPRVRVEEEVGRGEAVGAVWALTGGIHDTTALCVRDSELVRMSKGAFELISSQCPKAVAGMLDGMARRLSAASAARSNPNQYDQAGRSAVQSSTSSANSRAAKSGGSKDEEHKRHEIVTIALLPAGVHEAFKASVRSTNSKLLHSSHDSASSLHQTQVNQNASVSRLNPANLRAIEESSALTADPSRIGSNLGRHARRILQAAHLSSSAPSATQRAQSNASASSTDTAAHTTASSLFSNVHSPVNNPAAAAVRKLTAGLKATLQELFGATLNLSASTVAMTFPTAFDRLHVSFYRSKITSWMAAQEEDYRFILLEADTTLTPWSKICISQADCILLVASEGATPQIGDLEQELVWSLLAKPPVPPPEARSNQAPNSGLFESSGTRGYTAGGPLSEKWSEIFPQEQSRRGQLDDKSWTSYLRRVELVLLHGPDSEPQGTAAWLEARPHLARHHHIRLTHPKDLARLGRWMAGKAVGLVLSGGGSRGLAHLGVLHALDDAGVPVDIIGGTSQGAFMAALYSQGLAWEQMHHLVREYARQMSSVQHLLWDLTLPIMSVFNGVGFDRVVRETFKHGAQQIEDLWLSYFCNTTNLSKGQSSVHDQGPLWRLVRASMTIVGMVPPVYYKGDLLVDGGYMNNIPVDVMRSMGVDTVIVVDVEDRDDSVWHNLTPFDGGLSGWRLLWDRWCPIPRFRFGIKLPRYQQIVNALTWMSHSQTLRRVSREYVIDLYLRPPVSRFRLMDFHLMDRIVRDANRYAWAAISEWQCQQGVTQQGMLGSEVVLSGPTPMRRSHSMSCMTQLQAKHSGTPFDQLEGIAGPSVSNKGPGKDAKASSAAASKPAPPLSKTAPPPDDSAQASGADTTPTAVSSQPAADHASSSAAAEAPDSAPEDSPPSSPSASSSSSRTHMSATRNTQRAASTSALTSSLVSSATQTMSQPPPAQPVPVAAARKLDASQAADGLSQAGVSGRSHTEQTALGSLESSNSSWPGGLPDDMHSATTGLLTLEGDSLPATASPNVRPMIIPEVRRPSLRAGSGSTDYAAPLSRTDHRLSRRPSFVEGGSRENSLDAEFPALGNLEGRHAAQTYRWQQQHFGGSSNSHHHHS
ncbi:TPA: hypothetical protein ACH3X3_014241 [Trebouxia sp. C0006]